MTVNITITLRDSSGFASFDTNLLVLAQALAALGGPQIPLSPTVSGALSLTDAGYRIDATGNLTAPANIFLSGHAVTIRNATTSPITISQGSGLTLELAGTTTTGDRALAGKGVCTLLWDSPTVCSSSGAGLS